MDPCVRIITPGPFSRHLDPLDIAHSTYIEKCPPSLIDIVHDLYMPSNYIFFFSGHKKKLDETVHETTFNHFEFLGCLYVCVCVSMSGYNFSPLSIGISWNPHIHENLMNEIDTVWSFTKWVLSRLRHVHLHLLRTSLLLLPPSLSLSLVAAGGSLYVFPVLLIHIYINTHTHTHLDLIAKLFRNSSFSSRPLRLGSSFPLLIQISARICSLGSPSKLVGQGIHNISEQLYPRGGVVSYTQGLYKITCVLCLTCMCSYYNMVS